jgi:hypothetical protein
MKMDRTLRFGIIALVATIGLLAIAGMASADPSDITNEPTEDWVFDSGNTVTITSKVWTLSYNITVTSGTTLKIDKCNFDIDGVSEWDPVWIFCDSDSTLELTSSNFYAVNESSGFYVETHNNITITNCDFRGLVEDPDGNAGITVLGDDTVKAQMDFVKVYESRKADGIYFENVQVDMSNSEIYDIEGSGVTFSTQDSLFEVWYNLTLIDTEIYNCDGDGLGIHGVNHNGIISANVYNLDVWNVTDDAIWLLLGGTTGDNGNGSLFANFDLVDAWDIEDMAVYLSTLYTVTGTSANWSNVFNVTFTNSTFTDIVNTGMYVQLVYSTVDFNLFLDTVTFTNISLEPTFQRVGGIWWWFQLSQGQSSLYAENVVFKRCSPAAFETWDYGGCNYEFVNCDFSQMDQAAALLTVKGGSSQSQSTFENCTFHNSDSVGIDTFMESSSSGTIVQVSNCTFHNLSYPALNAEGSSYADGHGFNVTNSNIRDVGSYAIYLYGYYLEGSMTLHMHNSSVLRTAGIRIEIGQDSPNAGGNMDVIITNSTILESAGTGISLYGSAGYNSCRVFFMLTNSTIHDTLGDGVSVRSDILGTGRGNPRWDAQAIINNCDIEDAGGIGISLLSSRSSSFGNPGTRKFVINDTEIYGGQRGIFNGR